MSENTFLETPLDGTTVEWLPMGDERVGKFIRGGSLQKKDFVDQGVGCIHYGQIYTHYGLCANKTKTFVTKEFAKKARMAIKGDVIIATTSENDEDVCKAVAWLGDDDIAVSSDACFYRHILNPKYVSYFFQTNDFQKQKRGYITGAKVRRVNASNLSKIKIPIPCPDKPEKSLEIQAKIVRILDTFTALTTELATELAIELTNRKKQYNYYRDQLLTFDEGDVEWKTLGEVSIKSYSGGTPKAGNPEYYDDGSIPWLRTQEVKFSNIESTRIKITAAALADTAAKWIPENCVIIAISGATAGRSAINKIPLTTNQHCCCLEIDPTQALYRYVYHWVSFNYENLKGLGQGARGDLNSGIIKNFKIPIPYAGAPGKSLAEQARIVAILDKFDTLTNSISEGLPREIELREKQYAYYRDLLFNFPKPEGGA